MKIEIKKHEIENLKEILDSWYELSNDPDATWSMADHMHNEYYQAEAFIDDLLKELKEEKWKERHQQGCPKCKDEQVNYSRRNEK